MSIKNEKGSKMERKSNTIIWIPVNERIPKNNKKVLCFNGYRMIENSWSMHTDQDAEWFKKTFTYWTEDVKHPRNHSI